MEAHNQQLQASLFDIAQMVLDDADKDESGGGASNTDQNVSIIKSPSSPLVRAGR